MFDITGRPIIFSIIVSSLILTLSICEIKEKNVCFVDRCLSFCPFSFGHCVVSPSSIYIFFGIFKLFLQIIMIKNKLWKMAWCQMHTRLLLVHPAFNQSCRYQSIPSEQRETAGHHLHSKLSLCVTHVSQFWAVLQAGKKN